MNESFAQKTAPENLPFPLKLYAMLEDASSQGFEDIVSWLPSGEGFKVHHKERFEEYVMARYFNHTKYKSFLRQLNLYDFCRLSRGATKGSYSHQSFIRGEPSRCFHVKRATTRRNHQVARMTSSPEGIPTRVCVKRSLMSVDSIKPTLQQKSEHIAIFKGKIEMSATLKNESKILDEEDSFLPYCSNEPLELGGTFGKSTPLVEVPQPDPLEESSFPPKPIANDIAQEIIALFCSGILV
jgi:hypothetical protein